MNRKALVDLIRRKNSFLCVGLDTDPHKLPDHLQNHPDGVFEFNKAIVEATLPFAVSYKFNIAFYEALGVKGWEILERSLKLIPKGEALVIADAKRGDIGNTAKQYAKAFFENFDCDAITINPYMGRDSVTPFLEYKDRWSIVLGLTSNEGAKDIELIKSERGRYVFEETLERISAFGSSENLMFVVGATQPAYFDAVRKAVPDHFLLVPGVGAQGGKLQDLAAIMTDDCGLLVNSSRKIIYASSKEDFAEAAKQEAERVQQEMKEML